MEKSLKFFEPGESGIVKHVVGEGPVKRRLFDMGVTPGVEIVMKKLAPMGDPMEISLRGYELTLRKSEAEHIVMYVEAIMKKQPKRQGHRRGKLEHNNEIKSQIAVEGIVPTKVIVEDLYCGLGGVRGRGRYRKRRNSGVKCDKSIKNMPNEVEK